jgi:CHAT domain-containing protein
MISSLGVFGVKAKSRPRVHWIGTGILSSAPFHAAGDHSESSTANTISRVISSYIPTLRALSSSREASTAGRFSDLKDRKRALLVSVPDAPAAKRLAEADTVSNAIADVLASHVDVVTLKAATPSSVVQKLPLAQLVHLACHVKVDAADLSDSHLRLMPEAETTSGSSEPCFASSKVRNDGRLAMQQISARRAPSAELAFLSACSAAENGVAALADESVHIASSFHVAGFQNVVGTLWQTKDAYCKDVAINFYRELFARSQVEPLKVPEALDMAVRQLRSHNPERVLEWAPFVHIGAFMDNFLRRLRSRWV